VECENAAILAGFSQAQDAPERGQPESGLIREVFRLVSIFLSIIISNNQPGDLCGEAGDIAPKRPPQKGIAMKALVHTWIKTLVLAMFLGGVLGGPLYAQAPAFSDAKIDAFVTAALKVEQLAKKWAPQISNAATPEQAEQLRQQANAELAAAVNQTEGISVQEYMNIGKTAQGDPQLASRIEKVFVARKPK
jgi:hypothetical protein